MLILVASASSLSTDVILARSVSIVAISISSDSLSFPRFNSRPFNCILIDVSSTSSGSNSPQVPHVITKSTKQLFVLTHLVDQRLSSLCRDHAKQRTWIKAWKVFPNASNQPMQTRQCKMALLPKQRWQTCSVSKRTLQALSVSSGASFAKAGQCQDGIERVIDERAIVFSRLTIGKKPFTSIPTSAPTYPWTWLTRIDLSIAVFESDIATRFAQQDVL